MDKSALRREVDLLPWWNSLTDGGTTATLCLEISTWAVFGEQDDSLRSWP